MNTDKIDQVVDGSVFFIGENDDVESVDKTEDENDDSLTADTEDNLFKLKHHRS